MRHRDPFDNRPDGAGCLFAAMVVIAIGILVAIMIVDQVHDWFYYE